MITGNVQKISLSLQMWFLRCEWQRTTDRHTDTLIAILCTSPGGEVTIQHVLSVWQFVLNQLLQFVLVAVYYLLSVFIYTVWRRCR